MSIDFQCGQCGKKIRVADSMGGRQGKCPGCGLLVTVPFPSLVPEAEAAAPAEELYAIHEDPAPARPAPPSDAGEGTNSSSPKRAAGGRDVQDVDTPRLNRYLIYILLLSIVFLAAAWLMELFGSVAKVAIPQLAFSVGVPVATILAVLLLTGGRIVAFFRGGTARIFFLIILTLWLGVMIFSAVQASKTQHMTFSRLLLRRGPGYQKGVLRLAIQERVAPKVERHVPMSFFDKIVSFDTFDPDEDGQVRFVGDLGTYPVNGFAVFDDDEQLVGGVAVVENVPVYKRDDKGGARTVKTSFTVPLTDAGLPEGYKTHEEMKARLDSLTN